MLELIFIHIPKTAGTSFLFNLRQVYGEKNVFWSGSRDAPATVRNMAEGGAKNMPSVIGGHFAFSDVKKIWQETRVPIVTWLRDPVDRAISDYFFFISRIHAGYNRRQAHRKNESIIDWAKHPGTQNRMSRFLKGISLRDLYFFGFMDFFEEDLFELGRKLGWPPIEPVHLRRGDDFRAGFTPIQPETREYIRRFNTKDIELYRKACRLRGRSVEKAE